MKCPPHPSRIVRRRTGARYSSLLAVFTALAILTPSAGAEAGTSIATAPEIPLGAKQFGSGPGIDYWRVTLGYGDLLVLDYETTDADEHGTNVCLVKPTVTDFTLPKARCEVQGDAYAPGKREVRFTASAAGKWSLLVADGRTNGSWCFRSDEIVPTCDLDVTYELTAYRLLFTQTKLNPAAGHARKPLTFTGKVVGAHAGRLAMQARSGKAWKTIGSGSIAKNGSFRVTAKFSRKGTYQVRAMYPGDAGHRPSSSTVLRVQIV
jgi:hypothetical protein